MRLSDSVKVLSGVGEVVATKLGKLGILNLEDLLLHYPRRYDDYSTIQRIADVNPGPVTVKGRINQITNRSSARGRSITEAIIEDDSGEIKAVWFNQPYLSKQLPKSTEIYASGDLAFRYQQFALQNPVVERVSTFTKDTARIVPVYPETAGLSSKQIRRMLLQVLDSVSVDDPVPEDIRSRYDLMEKNLAIKEIHFPSSNKNLASARFRLAFEELYLLLLAVKDIKSELQTAITRKVEFDTDLAREFTDRLPFELTDDQRKSAWRIIKSMNSKHPMNRLLQGDVGSGKTVVAALAALGVIRADLQVAFLAPTEILARQHFDSLKEFLDGFDVDIEILTSGVSAKKKQQIYERIRSGDALIVVGTHSLLSPEVRFKHLGLLVIDEQHRFGVEQRRLLQKSDKYMPHTLSMSATPIPRSLALTVYGDLDISSIRQMPPGRKPVKTYIKNNARALYEEIYTHINDGAQVFVVCPLIEDSDTLGVMSVEAQLKTLRKYWKDVKIATMHGRLKNEEKQSIMADFANKKIDVLISTTVVEVGVDISGANVMLVEGAERFGLATLHQLRGRVGRSGDQAYCYLKTTMTDQAKHRLSLMERYSDGFTLAEKDLELRGAGELYGLRQHGALDFKLASLSDSELIEKARSAAESTENIDIQPGLKQAITRVYTRVSAN